MIPYEELVAALEGYAARKAGGGLRPPPMSPSPPGRAAPLPTASGAIGAIDYSAEATHVGGTPQDEHGEIDLGDVLSDEEL